MTSAVNINTICSQQSPPARCPAYPWIVLSRNVSRPILGHWMATQGNVLLKDGGRYRPLGPLFVAKGKATNYRRAPTEKEVLHRKIFGPGHGPAGGIGIPLDGPPPQALGGLSLPSGVSNGRPLTLKAVTAVRRCAQRTGAGYFVGYFL